MFRFALIVCLLIAPLALADDAERARFHWTMNCQGCHLADARGSKGGAPNMNGEVARFLAVEGGRDYLVRVPGVALSPLQDNDLANLLNWMLYEFDGEHMPPEFNPYTSEEVAMLRADPLVTEASGRRNELLARMEDG